MQIDEMIAVLQAARDGKTIQDSMSNDAWYDNPDPTWNFGAIMYRVKPEPHKTWLCVSGGSPLVQLATYASDANLELTFEEGVLVGAKVL